MAEYYGRNDPSTLKGLREAIHREAERMKERVGPYNSRKLNHVRAVGELWGYNLVLTVLDSALASGPTPPGILAMMEKENSDSPA